jgi:hypothetical protein
MALPPAPGLLAVLGVRWPTYDREIDRLYDTVKAGPYAPD